MANYGTITIDTKENTSFIRLKSFNDKLYKLTQNDTNYLLSQIIKYQKKHNYKYPALTIVKKTNKISISLTDVEHLKLIKHAIPRLNPESVKTVRKNKYTGIAAIATATAISLSTVGIIPNILKKTTSTKATTSTSSITEQEELKSDLIDFYKNYIKIFEKTAETIKSDATQKIKEQQEQKKKQNIKKESTTSPIPKIDKVINTEINIGNTTLTAEDIEKYETTANRYYDLFEKYGNIYGVDPLLLSYIATQERGEHSQKVDDNGGIGLCQIQMSFHNVALENCENWENRTFDDLLKESLISEINTKKISAYNFETGKKEKFISMSQNTKNSFDHWLNKTPGIIDTSTINNDSSKKNDKIIIKDISQLEDNIQYGAMIFSQQLKNFNGNIKLALFAYNQGADKVEIYIKRYAKQQGISYEEAMNSIPVNYLISAVPENYGDRFYLVNVLKYAIAARKSTLTCTYRDQNNNFQECKLTIKGQNIHTTNKSK